MGTSGLVINRSQVLFYSLVVSLLYKTITTSTHEYQLSGEVDLSLEPHHSEHHYSNDQQLLQQ